MKWKKTLMIGIGMAALFLLTVYAVASQGREEASATPEVLPVRTPTPTQYNTPIPSQPAAVQPVPMPSMEPPQVIPEEQPPPAATIRPSPTPTPTSTVPSETEPARPEPTDQPAPIPPTDEEVYAAYQEAREAYGWFYREGLPHSEEVLTLDGVDYHPVIAPGMETMTDLQGHLKGLFSDEIIDRLLYMEDARYLEWEGRLYVRADGQAVPGGETGTVVQILREGQELILVRIAVEQQQDGQAAQSVELHDYPYERVGEQWIFTEFHLYD